MMIIHFILWWEFVLSGAYLEHCSESDHFSRVALPAAGHWRGRPLSEAGTVSACEACWHQAPQTGGSSTPDVCGARRGSMEARLKRWRWQRTDCCRRTQGSSERRQHNRYRQSEGFTHKQKYYSQFSGPGWTAPHDSHRWHGLHWSGALSVESSHRCLPPSLWGCLLRHPHLRAQGPV